MRMEATPQEGWVLVEIETDARRESDDGWARLRADLPWHMGANMIVDVTDVEGVSDRMVETLVGMTVDASHRGRKLVVVGINDALHARAGSMEVEFHGATSLDEARAIIG